jgi:hypothetical protein
MFGLLSGRSFYPQAEQGLNIAHAQFLRKSNATAGPAHLRKGDFEVNL